VVAGTGTPLRGTAQGRGGEGGKGGGKGSKGGGKDQRFLVQRRGRGSFDMYREEPDHSTTFMLSAALHGEDFLISSYKRRGNDAMTDPGSLKDPVSAVRVCAVLKLAKGTRSRAYRLYLTGTHLNARR
jgi:hypothetical protein